jgi:disulfide bond formation protein DsbB
MAHFSSMFIFIFRILISEMDWILSGYHYSMLFLSICVAFYHSSSPNRPK